MGPNDHAASKHSGRGSSATSPLVADVVDGVADPFPQATEDLPEAVPTRVVELHDLDRFELEARAVRKRIGEHEVRMLAYNGSIPGPTLRVRQGERVTIRFTNRTEMPTTVHWHGLRVESRFDGMPHHGGPPPVAPGARFDYELRFPDAGIYWYHPHVREDYAQEHGLYANIIVVPRDESYWPPANRELTLVVDDILIHRGKIAAMSRSAARRTAMGRFGNVMLLNGETDAAVEAKVGDVIRLYVTNTANVRPFNLVLAGARLKLVGGDGGPYERETFVDEILIAPAERVVVDALYDRAGDWPIEHRPPGKRYRLGSISVSDERASPSHRAEFETLRANRWLTEELAAYRPLFDRAPDKTLSLIGIMPGMRPPAPPGENESEDPTPTMNALSSHENMQWKLVDEATGRANEEIEWSFKTGDRVMLRLRNDRGSDHPMQHPFHVHGQRFLVVARNGRRNDNLAWKDTVLVRNGEVVDILVDMTNPGMWMAHCHIAEHLESNMMLMFAVK
jgi:FtsP/CotA-like multicopper oxidase with cupredoxin domain